MSLHIAILYGSMREARNGIRLVRFLDTALRRRGHMTSVVDAAEHRLPLLDRMYKEYHRGSAPPVLEELAELYRKVDAFAIVGGEYNHGIQPGLKNLLDHFLEEYRRPVQRGEGRDAAAHDARRTRHAEHPVVVAGAARAGCLDPDR